MRRAWLSSKVCREESRRKKSIAYTLNNTAGETFYVCQKFFLGTLGYTQDQVIKSLFISMQANIQAATTDAVETNNNYTNENNNVCLVSPKDAREKHPYSKKLTDK